MPKKTRGDKKTTAKKQRFVQSLIANTPDITMAQAGQAVTKKFGTMLAFDKLREAFTSGGGKLTNRGRKRGTSTSASSAAARAALRSGIGRRQSDVRAAVMSKALSGLPTHLVFVINGAKAVPNIFSTSKQAEDYITKLIEGGASPSNVGYYERRPMGVTVQI